MRKNQIVVSTEKWEAVWGNLYYGTPHNYPINKDALELLAGLDVAGLDDRTLVGKVLAIIWQHSTGSVWPHMATNADVWRHERGVVLGGDGWSLHYEAHGMAAAVAETIKKLKEAA